MNLYEILNNLNIKYEELEHKPVVTSLEAQFIKDQINGIGVKNLFIKDSKNYFIVLLEDNKKADLKELKSILNSGHLSFASETELERILHLKRGYVTPLGIINDVDNLVTLVIDKDLKDNTLLVHPNINTKTISIKYEDLIKFIDYFKHKYISY